MLLGGYFKDAESTESIQAQTNFFFEKPEVWCKLRWIDLRL